MKFFKWSVILLILTMLILFVLQNLNRTPTVDTKGAFLSLDLYFWGLEQREPISLLWYFLGSFLLGMVFMKVIHSRQE